jgi:hypothetical protein
LRRSQGGSALFHYNFQPSVRAAAAGPVAEKISEKISIKALQHRKVGARATRDGASMPRDH